MKMRGSRPQNAFPPTQSETARIPTQTADYHKHTAQLSVTHCRLHCHTSFNYNKLEWRFIKQ